MRALVLVLLSGCMIGGSSSVVGRWRGHREVDSTACVQNSSAPGAACDKLITIARDIPPRRFTTMTFTFAAAGYAQMRGKDGYVGHGGTINGHLEYLYGKGKWAIGGRLGGNFMFGFDDRVFFTMPISGVAHLGDHWGSMYAGAGYSPVATEQQYVGEGEMAMALPATFHHNGVHAFAGTRFWINRKLERGLTLNPEVRVERFGNATIFSATFNTGLHL